MTTKQLTRRQARWAETLGCFDFEIIFRPGRHSSKPDALSRRHDLKPTDRDKLSFGQLLQPENIRPDTFTAISSFESFVKDDTIDMDNADYWFEINVLGIEPIATAEAVLSYPKKPSPNGPEPVRQARQFDEGVCVSGSDLSTTTPPQCEFDNFPSISPVSAGQPVPLLKILTDPEIIDAIPPFVSA